MEGGILDQQNSPQRWLIFTKPERSREAKKVLDSMGADYREADPGGWRF